MNHWTSRGIQRVSSSSCAFRIFLMRRSWSSESRIWKLCGRFASRQCMRSRRCAMPWKVPDPQRGAGHAQELLDAAAHFAGCLVRERDRENALR